MTRAEEFCASVGLSDHVRRWLSANEGDPLREDIVQELMLALDTGNPQHEKRLRFLISKIIV